MNAEGRSLRWLVDKWLLVGRPIRLTRYNSTGTNKCRCIRVESLHVTGSLEVFFFRHGDG
jgi:hypothetical protein